MVSSSPDTTFVGIAAAMIHDIVAGVAGEIFLPAAHAIDASDGEGILEGTEVIPIAADGFFHPHPLIPQMCSAIGWQPIADHFGGPQVGGELRPIALDRTATALSDLGVAHHVGAGVNRDLLCVGGSSAAGWPADVLHESCGAAHILVGETAIKIPAPAIRAAHILLMNGIVNTTGGIRRAVCLNDAVGPVDNVIPVVLCVRRTRCERHRAQKKHTAQ